MTFYELIAKVTEYEKLLREVNHKRKASMVTYFQDVSNIEITLDDLANTGSCVCPFLERKTIDA